MSKIIDIHCHILTESYKKFIIDNHGELEDGFALPVWNAKEHLSVMDACGIERSIVSVSSPHPYFGDLKSCTEVTRGMNEEAAELKRQYPDRFGFCASLPLPDIGASVEEIIYADDVLHADGVKLPSNCRGLYLGDPKTEPIWEEMNRRNLTVIIHPHKPDAVTDGVFSYGPVPLYEFLCDTTRAVMNLMAYGIPMRYPNVKIVVPHCGSFLPNIASRMESLQPVLAAQGLLEKPIDVRANIERLYFDLAGTPAPDLLPFLLTITTPDKIMYGGDFPFTPAALVKKNLEDLVGFLEKTPSLRGHRDEILSENARRLFRLPA